MAEKSERRFEICIKCGLRWNIALAQKVPKSGYVCPWCDFKNKKQNQDKTQSRPGQKEGTP